MADKKKYDVFLSYSAKDKDWVKVFSSELKKSGLASWFDASQLALGERWKDHIEEALRESRSLIAIVSPNSIHSPWTFFELGAALADHKRIIPVLTEGVEWEDLPSPLMQFQGLKEREPADAARRVAEVLAAAAEPRA
ncbi:MAG TPA: toll/interleukin-1 receptor domain-containing protein [Thermoanaerobaculia bacterium]|jgi:hypothetical protein|nr:toll/interleukin-1 receptor domain-containing protein [Thermoanaerobaculia bacterium]